MSLPEGIRCFALFQTDTDAMALRQIFLENGISARISPVPHGTGLKPGCGIALMLVEEQVPQAKACIEEHEAACLDIVCVPSRINPRRDQFC